MVFRQIAKLHTGVADREKELTSVEDSLQGKKCSHRLITRRSNTSMQLQTSETNGRNTIGVANTSSSHLSNAPHKKHERIRNTTVYSYEDRKANFTRLLQDDTLVFDSHFECGNLLRAQRLSVPKV